MFSDKPSVNILTSLLVAHRIRKAVLCPGSRNAPICHNLLETNQIECFPVTDERSAAFVAIGLCLGTAHAKCGLMPSRSENEEQDVEIADSLNKPTTLDPVALCLTSGSAILDAAPAVAEASYQGIPLVVIAADRPAEWIDQKDGQTLPQPTVLGSLVRCSVSLPLGNTPDELWYANRLVNHALMMASQSTNPGPVLINVPLTEPLYNFSTPSLPTERVVNFVQPNFDFPHQIIDSVLSAQRVLVIIGQMPPVSQFLYEEVVSISKNQNQESNIAVYAEPLSGLTTANYNAYASLTLFDLSGSTTNANGQQNEVRVRDLFLSTYRPDLILYFGGTLVSKELKHFMRACTEAQTIVVSPDSSLCDIFQNTTTVVPLPTQPALLSFCRQIRKATMGGKASCVVKQHPSSAPSLGNLPSPKKNISIQSCSIRSFSKRWEYITFKTSLLVESYIAERPSQLRIVSILSRLLVKRSDVCLSFANSSAVRLACMLIHDRMVFCNRGVNGIDGSVSTAVGLAAALPNNICLLVTGDLSFFYDQNALWNNFKGANLRILLLNNHGGGIFSKFKGLKNSPAQHRFVMAEHQVSARGICEQNGVDYMSVEFKDDNNFAADLNNFLLEPIGSSNDQKPRLLEVQTLMEDDYADLSALQMSLFRDIFLS